VRAPAHREKLTWVRAPGCGRHYVAGHAIGCATRGPGADTATCPARSAVASSSAAVVVASVAEAGAICVSTSRAPYARYRTTGSLPEARFTRRSPRARLVMLIAPAAGAYRRPHARRTAVDDEITVQGADELVIDAATLLANDRDHEQESPGP